MKKIVRLTESDLIKLVKRVISEQSFTKDEEKMILDAGFKRVSDKLYVKGLFEVVPKPDCGKYMGIIVSQNMPGGGKRQLNKGRECPDDCWDWWENFINILKYQETNSDYLPK